MIRKNTFTRNARRNVRRAENETSMRSRNRRFRRYEEDEKEGKEENLIDVVEVSDIVDKAVDAYTSIMTVGSHFLSHYQILSS